MPWVPITGALHSIFRNRFPTGKSELASGGDSPSVTAGYCGGARTSKRLPFCPDAVYLTLAANPNNAPNPDGKRDS